MPGREFDVQYRPDDLDDSSLCCSSHDHEVTSTGFTVIKLLRLGAERLQPFGHIRARARARPALERKPLGERVALSFVYEPLVGPNGVPGVRNDRSSKLVRYRFEFSVRNATVREAEGGRLRAADWSAGKHHLLGPKGTNPPPKPLAHAHVGVIDQRPCVSANRADS